MNLFRPQFLALAVAAAAQSSAFAESFVVQDIRVEGLQRVAPGTVFSYLPVRIGQQFDTDNSAQAVTDLYAINLFSRINLARDGNTLVVQVEEFPIISSIELKGNSSLSSSNVKQAFAKAGFAEGQPFNPAMLQEMQNQLYGQYHAQSKFQVNIDAQVNTLPRGRVEVVFTIDEGRTAQYKSIDFVGNRIYSDEQLAKLFDTSTTGWLSFMSKNDQINNERMQADYERLENFYKDRGFMDFAITSVQTALSEDKTRMFLTVNVDEGETYTIKDYRVSGDLIVPESELLSLIQVQKEQFFNHSAIKASTEAIRNRLADEGFGKADVRIVPDVDRLKREVALNFVIQSGPRVTVRRIEFTGNAKSYDSVLRRELRQQEMAPYSASDLERSEQRIRRLPQIEKIEKALRPVPGHPDQVDVVYTVAERSTSYIQGGIGYGQSSGALFSLEYADDNFLGTGNRFNINFGKGSYVQSYGLSVTNPYFTDDGISARFSFNYDEYDYDEEDLSDWTSDNLALMLNFGYPISEYQSVFLGGGYRQVKIHTGANVASEINDFLKDNGKTFNEFVLTGSWLRDTTDDAYMPTTGSQNSLSLELVVPGSDATYYRSDFKHRSFFSGQSEDSLVFSLHGNVSYGNSYGDLKGGLPFYRHYYAGGINSVRGYQYGSVGPRYKNNDYAGGDFRVTGGAELILPVSFSGRERNLRVGAFADAGGVWNKVSDFDTADMRYSTGLFLQWISPIGPLNLSYAVPLNKKTGDDTEAFQFTIGTTF